VATFGASSASTVWKKLIGYAEEEESCDWKPIGSDDEESFDDEEEGEEFSAALARCRNLEQLELEINIDTFNMTEFRSLVRGVEAHLKQVTLKLKCNGPEKTYLSMREFPSVWQQTRSVEILRAGPTGCSFSSASISCSSWVSEALQLFDALPNLQHISFEECNSRSHSQFGISGSINR